MTLTLLIPGLLLPEEILDSTAYDLDTPQLSRLIGRGRRRALDTDWLGDAFGLGPLPAAALRRIGAGETPASLGSEQWLCLDPVYWHVSPEGIVLDDPARLALTAAESDALREAVRPLFADWGELTASAAGRWELRLHRPLALDTDPLPRAIQQSIDPRLPGGADGAAWRRRLAEAQTLLHAHSVNLAREAAGQPTVNSLWPWGQGRLPATSPAALRPPFDAVWSDDPVLAGLCALAGVSTRPPPARFDAGEYAGRQVLAIIDTLAGPARALDALRWRDALLAVDRDWLAPALTRCRSLRLVGTRLGHDRATVAFDLGRGDRLCFWRKPRPATDLK